MKIHRHNLTTVALVKDGFVLTVVNDKNEPIDLGELQIRGAAKVGEATVDFEIVRFEEKNVVGIMWPGFEEPGFYGYDVFAFDGRTEVLLVSGSVQVIARVSPDFAGDTGGLSEMLTCVLAGMEVVKIIKSSVQICGAVNGKDGATPTIGANGNWWIAGVDQGRPSVIDPAPMVQEEVEKAVSETREDFLYTPEGTDNALFHWCQIDWDHVPDGRVTGIALRCRSTAAPQMTTEPRFLGVWEADEAGNFQKIASSDNAVAQVVGGLSAWRFEDLVLSVRRVRLCLLPSRESDWQAGSQVFGARVSAAAAGSLISYSAGQSAWLPEIVFQIETIVPRFAPALHVADAAVHVTPEERGRWNAKADTAALAKKADVTALEAHAGSRELHLDTFNDLCYMGVRSSTAGVFGGVDSSWLSARSDAVTFTANDDGFVYKINTSGAITELRLGEAELQALGYLLDRKASLEAVLQAPESMASHAGDSVRHVTAEERARWESAASGTLAANSTIADGGTGLASLNLHSDNAATLYVQRMESGNTRNAVALTVNNRLSKLDVWGAAAGIEVSNKAAPGETPTARCRITATTSSPGLKLDDMPLVMTIGGTTLTLGAAELQALAALIARKDELLALLTPNTPTT